MKIREARVDDAARLESLRVRAWRAAYPGLVDQQILDDLDPDDPTSALVWKNLIEQGTFGVGIAENEGGDLVGFCAVTAPSRDDDEPDSVAEVIALYVSPDHLRRGIGTALMEAVIRRLREADADWSECTVWTLEANTAALALYHELGFERDGSARTEPGWRCPDVRLRLRL